MKRSPHLEPLSHDHYTGLLVAGRLRQGLGRRVAPEVMAAYVAHVWRYHLDPHFRREESLLLPLLDTPSTAALAERMVHEHRLIRNLVTLAEADAGGRTGHLAEFARLLQAHIRFEERTVFPALEAQIPEEVLRTVGAQLLETPGEADPGWGPAFWE